MGDCFIAIFPIKAKEKFLGTINFINREPRKLTIGEIRLINSMADQIGVAVENISLFEEVENKTKDLETSNAELREALEHQTATAEVLGIISRSPTDVQPVLDAIVESADRVCGIDDVLLRLRDGNSLVARAHFGPYPLVASKSVWTFHRFSGCASMVRFIFPIPAPRRMIFPIESRPSRLAHMVGRSTSPTRRIHRMVGCPSH